MRRNQRWLAVSHSPGRLLSTASRMRVSSPRLWSCVAVASRARGKRFWRSLLTAWNPAGVSANCDGSLPTSLRLIRRPVAIEGGVLDRLRRGGRGQLLEADHGALPLGPPGSGRALADAGAGDQAGDQFQQLAVGRAHGAAGTGHGPIHRPLVGLGDAGGSGVDAVGVEVDQDLREHGADAGEGVVAGREVAAGDAMQRDCGVEQFAGQAFAQDLATGGLGLHLEVAGAAGGGGPVFRERCFAGRVMQGGARRRS